ncbi:zinc transport system substrate-binding protein [Geodermatophilus amargosae]|uniref:Zinc transport system substrate-binding protein n=1 Tax=Geodermatophilus amargosae TaxID=1296565 RepID=A0A1I7CFV1_9ACTN|nr:metal ABC transporter substrate-binding protein [Geodermatophilus amargosae]SFT98262.1 zinc transport system substrate-binding protein [Geodermatophilus amargosae]
MPTTTRVLASATAAATALLLAACGSSGDDEAAAADGVSVEAAFYPLQWAAQRVGGDRVDVSSLTPPGAEPHDLELTPQDVASLSDADLVVYLEGFQPALDDAVVEAGDAAWDAGAAAGLSLTTTEEHGHEDEEEHAEGEEEHAEGEEEHAEGEEEHAEGEEEHAEGEEVTDPHFWLDPTRLADVGDALADRLAEVDPDGADTYRDNAAALRTDLEALDAEMEQGLADCAVPTLVTSHDAFGYLAERYGLDVVGISGLSPSSEPSPAQLAEISSLVQERGVTTVYTETLVDPAVAETVAREAGVQTAVLDPIEGLTDESAGDDYLAVMRADLATLQEGQGCA